MTSGQVRDRGPGRSSAGSLVRRTVVGVLAAVGALALVLALGVALLGAGLHADDVGVQQAADRLDVAAHALPGVRSSHTVPGLGDLGTEPRDLYGEVHLADSCSLPGLASATTRITAVIAAERTFSWHPTVWCRGLGVTVSPIGTVTRQRLDVLALLAKDRSLVDAAVIAGQRGDDPSPDVDDGAVEVDLTVRPRTAADAARRWRDRLWSTLPGAAITATTARPGHEFDDLALQDGQWAVVVATGDGDQDDAILRAAAALEENDDVRAAYCDGTRGRVTLRASDRSVLHELEHTLPAAERDATTVDVVLTLEHGVGAGPG